MRKIIGLLLLALAIAWPASATTLTGTIKRPDGTNLTGRLRLTLSHPARNKSDSTVVVPTTVEYAVTAGALPGTAAVAGNDVLEPTHTYYWAEYLDSNRRVIARNAYYIAGVAYDFGQARPTTVTTSNIGFIDLGALSGAMLTINVKNYGAKGDGATDDTVAIRAAGDALQTLGTGILYFPKGIYRVWSIGTTVPLIVYGGNSARPLVGLHDLNGVWIKGDNATLAMDPLNLNMAVTQDYSEYFWLARCKNILVEGLVITGPPVTDYARFNYPNFVHITHQSENISIVDNDVAGVCYAVGAVAVAGAGNGSNDIYIRNLTVRDSYYGINHQNSGDNTVVDNLHIRTADRGIFAYGMKGLRGNIDATDVNATIIDLSVGGGYGTSTEDIDLKVTEHDNTVQNCYTPIAIEYKAIGLGPPGIFRNLRFDINLNANAALGGQAFGVGIVKEAQPDAGRILDGLEVTGYIGTVVPGVGWRGPVATSAADTWAGADFWRNVSFRNLRTNSGANDWNIQVGSLVDNLLMENVTASADIHFTNVPDTAQISLQNVVSTNLTDHWTDYAAPVFTCSGAMTIAGGAVTYRYKFLDYRTMMVQIRNNGFTLAGAADTTVFVTLPLARTARNTLNMAGFLQDFAASGFSNVYTTAASNLLGWNSATGANWTLGAGGIVSGIFTIELQP